MSYDPEELRVGIVEMFEGASSMSLYRAEFSELPRRVGSTPKMSQRERGINSIKAWAKQVATLLRNRHCVCSRCGARAEIHRCPVRRAL
jgi:hypothetical protein